MNLYKIECFDKFGDCGGFYLAAKYEDEVRKIMRKKVIECNIAGYYIRPVRTNLDEN